MKHSDQIEQFMKEYLLKGKPRVGFGLIKYDKEVIKSLKKSKKYTEDIILVGNKNIDKIKGFNKIIADNPNKKLAELLVNGEIDVLVRGTIDDWETWLHYHELMKFKFKPENVLSAPIVRDYHGRTFFMNPASNMQGWDAKDKIRLVEEMVKYVKTINITPKVAIFCATRPSEESYEVEEEIGGELNKFVKKTLREAEEVASYFKKRDIEAKNFWIDLSASLDEGYNILVPFNGMVGNQIIRAVTLIGGGKAIACPILNIPHIYEEGSRNEKDFESHIKWAVSCYNKKHKT